MKNSLIKRVIKCACLITITTTVCLFASTQKAYSQTTLSVGDLAFTGMNCDGNDSFSFILLADIANNTVIRFTDKGWTGSAFNTGEGEITYTNNTGATIVEKTQITIRGTGTAAAVYSGTATSAGSVSITTNLGPSSGGDQIFAYQGTTGSPTIIAGIHINVEQSGYYTGSGLALNTGTGNWDGTHNTSDESRLSGSGLTNGTNCVWLRNTAGSTTTDQWEQDNWRVKASALSGTIAAIRSACNDVTNWDFDNTNQFNPCAPVVAAAVTTTTWNGTTWSNGAPTSTIDAVIASTTTPGAFTCKDLTINGTFDLTLNSGVTATIEGDLTNNGNGTGGTGTLRFTKTGTTTLGGNAFDHAGVVEVATGTTLATASKLTLSNGASLMHGTSTPNGGGSVSGSVTLDKTIGSTTDGWRTFALPVEDLIDDFETGLNTRCSNTSPSDRRNVYYWDGTNAGANTANGWTVANNTSDDENKGYSIYLSNSSSGFFDFSSSVRISGTPNNGTKTFNLDYTYDPNSTKTLTSERGWNLIPNYFPSNLGVFNLINDADFDPSYKAVHIWDQGASQMKAINQSTLVSYNSPASVFSTIRQIPPFMAFWVKATASSQSVQVKNYMRTGRSDSLPANTYFKTNYDVFRIEIKDQDGYEDQFSTAFIEGATDNFDNEFDIYKFKSFSDEVPTLYTKDANGELISLAALPIKESYSVPVYLESEKDKNTYTIKAITEEYSNYYNVELVDNKTQTRTNILEDDYTLNFDKNYTAARLTLNFTRKSATSIDEIYSQEKSYAYTNDNGINIVYQNNSTAAQANVEIYNTVGQLLFSQNNIAGGNGVSYMPTSSNTQVYIVRVISNGKANTIKVMH